jgi:UDP-glucuronate decarboxylase
MYTVPMRVLITGSAGFLGSHLVEKFLNEGNTVIGLDDFSTGKPKNMKVFLKEKNFSFIEKDVREKIDLEVDLILNFACPASPKAYQSDPVRTIETNFLGMINLLQLAKKTEAKIVQASTSEVYGDPSESPQKESYWGNVNPIGIRSCYDEGKRAAETLCFDYKRQFEVDARVIRIFNTYGPNMAIDDGRVVSNFVNQALTNKPLTLYGDGTQTRSLCYVSDLVEGIYQISMLEKPVSTPVNLGNPNEYSMHELAKKVILLSKSKSNIVNLPLPADDPKQRKPDIKLATKILDWYPKINIEDGLLKTIEYFSNNK